MRDLSEAEAAEHRSLVHRGGDMSGTNAETVRLLCLGGTRVTTKGWQMGRNRSGMRLVLSAKAAGEVHSCVQSAFNLTHGVGQQGLLKTVGLMCLNEL